MWVFFYEDSAGCKLGPKQTEIFGRSAEAPTLRGFCAGAVSAPMRVVGVVGRQHAQQSFVACARDPRGACGPSKLQQNSSSKSQREKVMYIYVPLPCSSLCARYAFFPLEPGSSDVRAYMQKLA